MSDFVHLHTHSHYSLLNALPRIPELVKEAKKHDMKALALTDSGNLYGAIQFYKKCKEEGIKPIMGVDFYVAFRGREDKQAGIDSKRYRLVLLAENNEGYKNLIKLVTESHLTGFYYKPRIDRELMKKYSDGLIAIIPSFSGEPIDYLKRNDEESAQRVLDEYKEIYGEKNMFLEISHHPEIEGHAELQKKIITLAQKSGIELVAAHDVYYIKSEDKKARDTLVQVQNVHFGGGGFSDEKEDFSFINTKQARKFFKDQPRALENTNIIADRCAVEIQLGEWQFPQKTIQGGLTPEEELRRLAYEGIKERRLTQTPEITDRIEYELDVINRKGYAPYFLIVHDLITFADQNGIYSNIRGSVAGSIVTYLTGITKLDPLEYKLPFERFLNPDRPSPPDIDMDFADNRRDEVLDYARKTYGEDKVAQIGTFGTMLARGSVRDVARALGHPYETGDRIAKLIPLGKQGFPMTIDIALKEVPELKELYTSNEDARDIIDMAKKVEGCARHISVHAAGVVIAPKELVEYVPLQLDPKGGKLITQYDMYAIEDIGLIKFDFLGLKNLSILADAVKRVKWHAGKEVDIQDIPLDDTKTYEMLSRGETHGTFQLNGSGMTRFLKELAPTTIHDINAMVALYRPGPMDFIPEYIRRKKNPQLIDYPHESLREDLELSYGLLIYQEDVMLTAIKLAGYSWLEADQFRKAMGKKIPKLMAEQEEKFKSGCIKNGIAQEVADDLWERIKPFAAYAFNKNHSASYGRVAYQTAYMKANYPVEYMAAVLTADSGNVEKIAETIKECERMGLKVLPPDINESFGTFTIVEEGGGKQIRFGLYTIKNFGEGIADAIIENRTNSGPFESLPDFLERIHDRNLNKKSLEALIKAGALDQFGERGQMLANIDGLLAYNKENGGSNLDQSSLFGLMQDNSTIPRLHLEESEPASIKDRLMWEKELLGLYISGHPLDRYRELLEGRKFSIRDIKTKLNEGMIAVPAGIIEEAKHITTKKGEQMAFLRVADFTDAIEVVVFPSTYAKFRDMLTEDSVIAVRGRVSKRNQMESLVAEAVKKL